MIAVPATGLLSFAGVAVFMGGIVMLSVLTTLSRPQIKRLLLALLVAWLVVMLQKGIGAAIIPWPYCEGLTPSDLNYWLYNCWL